MILSNKKKVAKRIEALNDDIGKLKNQANETLKNPSKDNKEKINEDE